MEPKLKGNRWEKEFEEEIRQAWRKNRVFAFNPESKKPIFSIDTPPPYVNFPIHMGHAATYTIMDFIARFKRMCDFSVLFPLGLDRNGLPIEVATEKKFGISIKDTPREKFIWMCKKLLEESSMESLESFYRLGHSYNSWNPGDKPGDMYYTDSYAYRSLTQATFIDLWKKGMIYTDKRVNNYCPKCQTTLADAEIAYKDLPAEFVYVKWKIKGTDENVIIGTTRPELLATCGMVVYNPKDERYRHLKGKNAIVPLYGKEVPIKPHPYAKKETGTGLMMMCSFGDYTDVRFFREMNIEPVFAIDTDGRMNESSGFLKGMKIEEARKAIIQKLEKENLVERKERTVHRAPICERSKTPIEFIAMPEYYLKQLELKGELTKNVVNKTKFHAPKSKQLILDWMNSLTMDWAISRRRYYATEIPLWYCKCGEIIVPKKGKYYRPWKEKPPVKCPKCGGRDFCGEDRVFDTWFDSSISPLYILGYGRESRFFQKAYPCSLRPQGKEIVRTWLYYTLLRCYQLTKKQAFRNVWIHFHILDEKGIKMSKSLGNVIDPKEVIEKFGAEPFRAWCALEGNITSSDLKCSFERIEGGLKFLTKLWNVARFISMFEPVQEKEMALSDMDKLILSEISRLIAYSKKHYENFDFHKPSTRMKHFIWEVFASNYMELVKNRAYNQEGLFSKAEQNAAIYTLNKVLDNILLVMYPILPFITHRIYKDMRSKDIESEKFPVPWKLYKVGFSIPELLELNGKIWKSKKDKGLSLKTEIKEAVLPEKFKPIEKDLMVSHSIKSIKWGKKLIISIEIGN
ncbi:MAG: valine--tRNA ligase [Candidatus Aenigmarchaeota archaeon]|nr:valine--tRNA ligase [Candidatus Aenigmarchaeota archaeon]